MMLIATWNLCLGFTQKKNYIYQTLNQEEIDICAFQEVEIHKDYPIQLLSSRNYQIEIDKHTNKARSAIAIKNNIQYIRRSDLEVNDTSLMIIDINLNKKFRLINVYRQFNPPHNLSQTEHFAQQLAIINNSSRNLNGRKLIILGDFNLDDSKRNSFDYRHKNLFELQNETFEQLNLYQQVNFPTWQRIINNEKKESILDHIYVQDPTFINSIHHITPLIGDHKLILCKLLTATEPLKPTYKRNWLHYSKIKLLNALSSVNLNIEADTVQPYWNRLESILLTIIDNLAPLESFINNCTSNSLKPTGVIKRKINLRKRLLNKINNNPTNAIRDRIKNLNIEIKNHFLYKKTSSVRRKILPGNTKSLWDAVKIAKDINIPMLPTSMFLNNTKIMESELPDAFAEFFTNKVNTITNDQTISNSVYNGVRKINAENQNFMTETEIRKAIKSLKPKNCEGHDRIPLRILTDGMQILIKPLKVLFEKIYDQKQIPEQWFISKVMPIHKKGDKSDITNYRPISNLCSCSKIYEKLILNRINNIQTNSKVDLTGKSQHGFKSNHSTLTAGLRIQSLIARAVDDDMSALMASLDLSAAFDVVNIELLLERLKILGLPPDVVTLIDVWLKGRYFYVSLDGDNSFVHESNTGTVQGSILGPILFSLFVSPLIDLAKITLFADDNYVIVWNKHRGDLIIEMTAKLSLIIKWFKDSGLKVNESKTELCLFHRKDQLPIEIDINNTKLISKNSINVLGITFDSKMNWQNQIENVITKAKKALHAIKLVRKYFNKNELLRLITANYYSILYYNSEIWHLPSNTYNCKKQLLTASALPLKLCVYHFDQSISYDTLHTSLKRAKPAQFMLYKHALLLHKIYNDENSSHEWQSMFFNQTFSTRATKPNFIDNSNYKIGKNLLENRFSILNNLICFEMLNLSYDCYKIKCKTLFITQ